MDNFSMCTNSTQFSCTDEAYWQYLFEIAKEYSETENTTESYIYTNNLILNDK